MSVFVFVHHADLAAKERSRWKPMLKRVQALARMLPTTACLPARGWAHFDGKKFICHTTAGVGFTMEPDQAHAFLEKLKRIEDVRVKVYESPGQYFNDAMRGAWHSPEGALSGLAAL